MKQHCYLHQLGSNPPLPTEIFAYITSRLSLVDHELLLTLPEHLSSHPRFKWDSCCSSRPIACHHIFSSMLCCLLRFPCKNIISFVFIPYVFRGLCFILSLYLFMHTNIQSLVEQELPEYLSSPPILVGSVLLALQFSV